MNVFKRLRNSEVAQNSELDDLKAMNTELQEIIIHQKQMINELKNKLGIEQSTELYNKLANEYIDKVSANKGYNHSVKEISDTVGKLALLNGKPLSLSHNSFARLKVVLDILTASDEERISVLNKVDTQIA